MKIDMPSENEIRTEIDKIITQGLGERKSFYSYLENMYRQIGLKCLFHDYLEIVFTIFLVSSVLVLMIKGRNIYHEQNIQLMYAYLFTASPILYLSMSILSFINVKQNKTYEIEMTCKYNLYQIVTFRMLVFSVICILFNFFLVYAATYFYEKLDFVKALVISIASLFLFSVILLFAMIRIKNRFIKYFVILGWIVFNFTLYMLKVDFYIQLLNSISIYTWLIVTIGSILAYVKNLKTLTIFRNEGGMI